MRAYLNSESLRSLREYKFSPDSYERAEAFIDELKKEAGAEPDFIKVLYKISRTIYNAARIAGIPLWLAESAVGACLGSDYRNEDSFYVELDKKIKDRLTDAEKMHSLWKESGDQFSKAESLGEEEDTEVDRVHKKLREWAEKENGSEEELDEIIDEIKKSDKRIEKKGKGIIT